MARITYSGIVSGLRGSIGGQTFQNNVSGSITKLKNFPKNLLSYSQLMATIDFKRIVALWSQLSQPVKEAWSAFALLHVKPDYWGENKQVTGFNYFLSINQYRYLCGVAFADSPPAFLQPSSSPRVEGSISGGIFNLNFLPAYDSSDNYIFVFASPPVRSVTNRERKKLRLISILSPSFYSVVDLTSAYESYFNITLSALSGSSSFTVLTAVALVDKISFLSNSFSSSIFQYSTPLNNFSSFANLGKITGDETMYSSVLLENNVVLAGFSNNAHIARSVDAGASWSDLGSQLASGQVLSICNLGNGVVVAGCSAAGVILRSINSGLTWSSLGTQHSATYISGITNLGGGVALAVTYPSGKYLKTTDYGLTWSDEGNLFSLTNLECIIALSPSILLIGSFTSGKILRSENSGVSWSDLGTQFSQASILCFCNLGGGRVLAGTRTSAYILVSTDYGQTWSISYQFTGNVRVIAMCYCGNGVVLASVGNSGSLYISYDYGATFTVSPFNFSTTALRGLLYAGAGVALCGSEGDGFVYRSLP